jgi:septum formation protein
MSVFWKSSKPLILASRSPARKAMLEAAGVPVETRPAEIDERAVERSAREGVGPAELATLLAEAKAVKCSRLCPDRLVLAADQIFFFDGVVHHKPADRDAAKTRLAAMSGREHVLYSAAALARDGEILFRACEEANLSFRSLSSDFITRYVETCEDDVLSCAGGYALEGRGVQLMHEIRGDHSVILGLPLLPVLRQLRDLGCLLA